MQIFLTIAFVVPKIVGGHHSYDTSADADALYRSRPHPKPHQPIPQPIYFMFGEIR